jgi:hypothetical protein
MDRIAIVQGAAGAVIDELFAGLVERWSPVLRIAGVLAEPHGIPDRTCRAGFLRCIATGKRYSLFDESGQVAEFCNLDGSSAAAAAEAAAEDIARGCDLVILNKYAKLEQGGEGLCQAFAAALRLGIPLLTSVSPARSECFGAFVGSGFATLAPDPAAIDAWVDAARAPAA